MTPSTFRCCFFIMHERATGSHGRLLSSGRCHPPAGRPPIGKNDCEASPKQKKKRLLLLILTSQFSRSGPVWRHSRGRVGGGRSREGVFSLFFSWPRWPVICRTPTETTSTHETPSTQDGHRSLPPVHWFNHEFRRPLNHQRSSWRAITVYLCQATS